MCWTGPFKYMCLKGYIYSPCYYHHQIGSIHLSHCFHIFPWLCAWDVCHIIFCHILYMHSGKTGNLFSIALCSLWWVQIVGYVLTCISYKFVCTLHHLIIIIVRTLSEDIEHIKCVSDIISVWVRLSIFSQLSIIHYVGLCVFSLPISFVMIEILYMLCLIIIIKSEVWTITHCLGLGHETMVCAVCLSIFLSIYKLVFTTYMCISMTVYGCNIRITVLCMSTYHWQPEYKYGVTFKMVLYRKTYDDQVVIWWFS